MLPLLLLVLLLEFDKKTIDTRKGTGMYYELP